MKRLHEFQPKFQLNLVHLSKLLKFNYILILFFLSESREQSIFSSILFDGELNFFGSFIKTEKNASFRLCVNVLLVTERASSTFLKN